MHKPLSAIALAAGLVASGLTFVSSAQAQALDAAGLQTIDAAVNAVAPKMVNWRRDIHAHPELSGQEVRTAKLVAEHLKKLGMEVQTGVGGTGVVGTLKGGLPGKVVALRADMDALPVTERSGLPFESKATAVFRGETVGVMHACGHDAHTGILMGVAEALASMKDELPGEILFIFNLTAW